MRTPPNLAGVYVLRHPDPARHRLILLAPGRPDPDRSLDRHGIEPLLQVPVRELLEERCCRAGERRSTADDRIHGDLLVFDHHQSLSDMLIF